jgi:hypothetical protein
MEPKQRERPLPRSLARGALAGTAATVVMSAVMAAGKRRGLLGRAPPRRITERLLRRVHPLAGVPRPATRRLSALAHFAFGAASGALFEALAPRLPVRRPVAAGAAYGALVWAGSYAGWAPVLGLHPPAHRDRPGRQAVMLAAHLVYGATLGLLGARRPRSG